MGHGEDAVPGGRRLFKKIVLAALPVGAGWAVVGPLVEDGLERALRSLPLAVAVKHASFLETFETRSHFFRSAIDGIFAGAADKLADGYRLELALDANQVQFAKHEAAVLRFLVGGFIDDDVRAVVFVEPFEARGEVHGVAERRVAVTQRRAQ